MSDKERYDTYRENREHKTRHERSDTGTQDIALIEDSHARRSTKVELKTRRRRESGNDIMEVACKG
jgi:hypothetical protein